MQDKGRLRAVYILAASNFVFVMGYGMYGFIFPIFLASVHASPPQVGLVTTLLAATMAITLVPGGILSDGGHRRMLVIASWLLPVFAPPFFILAELADSWLYAIPGVVVFASSWIGVAAVQSYTSEAAPTGKRGLSFSILVSSSAIGFIPSPIVGGLIFEAYGYAILFLLSFTLYAVSTAMVLAIPRLPGDFAVKKRIARGDSNKSSEFNDAKVGDRTEERREAVGKEKEQTDVDGILRRLIPMLALSCFLFGFAYIGWSYIPLYLSGEYGFSNTLVQLMYTIQNFSSIVIINALGKLSDKYSPANKLALVMIPVVSLILAYLILLWTPSVAILSVSFVLMGSLAAVFPLIYSTVGELSAGKSVGRTYGVIGTFIYAAEASTPYMGGTLYAISGQLPFMLTLALSPILLVLVFMAHRRTR